MAEIDVKSYVYVLLMSLSDPNNKLLLPLY